MLFRMSTYPAAIVLASRLLLQRGTMDKLLYDPDNLRSYCGPSGRVIVIAFCRAASIFISRLLEACGSKSLHNIIVVSLPYPDTISRAGGVAEIEEYRRAHGGAEVRVL